MHLLEPFDRWQHIYDASTDERLPFFGESHDSYDLALYDHLIHPDWDYIGSETLYAKVLFADYNEGSVVIELLGEWNDTLHNDIMHLKRNLIDVLLAEDITKFVLIGEHVLNFHGLEDDYYQEWFEEVEDGWIATIQFRDFIHFEWKRYGLDGYLNWGGNLEIANWRTLHPARLVDQIGAVISRRLGA
jgi:hypothetical protein